MLRDNKKVPTIMAKLAYFIYEDCNEQEKPIIKSNKEWYIWYFTPTSKLANLSKGSIFLKACAPKAPRITENNPYKEPTIKVIDFI